MIEMYLSTVYQTSKGFFNNYDDAMLKKNRELISKGISKYHNRYEIPKEITVFSHGTKRYLINEIVFETCY